MTETIKKFKNNKIKIIFFIFFLVNLLISFFSNYKDGGDDIFYKNASLNYSWWNFLIYRYTSWTGRMVPELLTYLFLGKLAFLWPILNATMVTLLSFLIYKCANIFNQLKQNKKEILALAVCFSFLLINGSVIKPAIIWRTGSMFYLWSTTLGFLAFYPFLLSIKNELRKKHYLFYFLISLIAAILTEQVSIILILGIITYFAFMLRNKKKIYPIIYLMSINIIVGSLVLFLAPGNQVRLQQETARNFPEFLNLGIFNRISISLYWVLNKFVNILPLTLSPIFLILGFKNYKNSNKILFLLALILGITLVIKSVFGLEYKVYPITSDNILSFNILTSYFMIILGLIFIPILIWKTFKISKKTLIYFLILLAILSLMVMITLSPTLDVSGNRTLFLPSVLLNIASIFIFLDIWDNNKHKNQ